MKIALNTPGPGDGYNLRPIEGMPDAGLGNLQSIIQWGTTMLMIISVFLAVFFLIWGSIQWILSKGDKAAIEAARNKIVYALIGLVVIFSSFLIINLVSGIFGVDFFG